MVEPLFRQREVIFFLDQLGRRIIERPHAFVCEEERSKSKKPTKRFHSALILTPKKELERKARQFGVKFSLEPLGLGR